MMPDEELIDIIEAAMKADEDFCAGGTFSNARIVVDGIYDRLVDSGGGGLAVHLALEQLRAAGVNIFEAPPIERERLRIDEMLPAPAEPEICRPRGKHPKWRTPGPHKSAGSKLARKAARGRL